MTSIQRAAFLEAMMAHGPRLTDRLEALGVSRSTYYVWKKRYDEQGIKGLERRPSTRTRFWNALDAGEEAEVLRVALAHPELSPRLVALKVGDECDFTVSESKVFRLLKSKGLIRPRPLDQNPASKQWRHQTKRVDEIWQCDAKNIFIPGWGRYKAIPVEDDCSRKLLALPLKPDETSDSISDAVEEALENSQKEGHTLTELPDLLSDNGPGFIGEVLVKYLKAKGIRQIHGAPYHPQTQGKVERLNRKIKERVCLVVYGSPSELQAALDRFRETYNQTPHEALKNVCPNDVYAGRQEEVLRRRAAKKRLTMFRRRRRNQARNG